MSLFISPRRPQREVNAKGANKSDQIGREIVFIFEVTRYKSWKEEAGSRPKQQRNKIEQKILEETGRCSKKEHPDDDSLGVIHTRDCCPVCCCSCLDIGAPKSHEILMIVVSTEQWVQLRFLTVLHISPMNTAHITGNLTSIQKPVLTTILNTYQLYNLYITGLVHL